MKIDFNIISTDRELRIRRLSKLYILALISIAALALIGQLIAQFIISRTETYDHPDWSTLRVWEFLIFIATLIVLVIFYTKIIRPTNRQVHQFITKLQNSERNEKNLSKEIGALYNSLEKSYEELSQINLPVESYKLYAKTDLGGTITSINEHYYEGKVAPLNTLTLPELFTLDKENADWMDELVAVLSTNKKWMGSIRYVDKNDDVRHANLIVVPIKGETGEIIEWLVLGADTTLQKKSEDFMLSKNKAAIERKINQQKFRSVLILEGQEEERKRLAMDIHDGIGQMLTSLKFQIESVDLKKPSASITEKLTDIKVLITETIKEVRRVTFNLNPTVLGDYGLLAAVSLFLKEVGKLSDVKLSFSPSPGLRVDLPQKVENNIFRIIQEAVNNAIKYSQATTIDVSITMHESALFFSIVDNGMGFDEHLIEARGTNIESGRGFFNMYERTEYVNGELEIKSKPNEGTSITLKLPQLSIEEYGN